MRHCHSMMSAICFALLLGTGVHAQQPSPTVPPPFSYGPPITLEQARKAAAAAEAEAKKRNMIMTIAIVEPNGDLVYFLKMDGALYASTRVAQSKAVSAAIYARPTRVFRERVAKGDLSPMALVDAVASDGGVPIVVNGKTIGAIGASGGADHDIAQAGADALK
jgi:glc operon protein GlcG